MHRNLVQYPRVEFGESQARRMRVFLKSASIGIQLSTGNSFKKQWGRLDRELELKSCMQFVETTQERSEAEIGTKPSGRTTENLPTRVVGRSQSEKIFKQWGNSNQKFELNFGMPDEGSFGLLLPGRDISRSWLV